MKHEIDFFAPDTFDDQFGPFLVILGMIATSFIIGVPLVAEVHVMWAILPTIVTLIGMMYPVMRYTHAQKNLTSNQRAIIRKYRALPKDMQAYLGSDFEARVAKMEIRRPDRYSFNNDKGCELWAAVVELEKKAKVVDRLRAETDAGKEDIVTGAVMAMKDLDQRKKELEAHRATMVKHNKEFLRSLE